MDLTQDKVSSNSVGIEGILMSMDESLRSEFSEIDEDIIVRAELASNNPTCKCMRSTSTSSLGW